MCRPIESRDSLGVLGPAAVALFAGDPPPAAGGHKPMNQKAPVAWPLVSDMDFGASGMNLLNMSAPPSALPFVSFPKANIGMPWAAPDISRMDPPTDPFIGAVPDEEKVESVDDAQELEELLDFSMSNDVESVEKEDNLDDGFDGTEMSILYSFLVDGPEENETKTTKVEDGILNVNVLTGSSIDGLMEVLETDFTDTEFLGSPPSPDASLVTPTISIMPEEMKSRRLCKSEGCFKRSRSNGLCISHGGGRRCAVAGCDKSSQGGNLCIRHGGGKRCSHEGCHKAAQSNFLCKAHGGGPRCQFTGCSRSSQGGGFCRSHGGGKRCMFDGCYKGTQRGDYCALHGGSRLCEIPGCMRNDRGGGLCATHGGGKRCNMEGCSKPCRRKGLCSAHLRQAETENK